MKFFSHSIILGISLLELANADGIRRGLGHGNQVESVEERTPSTRMLTPMDNACVHEGCSTSPGEPDPGRRAKEVAAFENFTRLLEGLVGCDATVGILGGPYLQTQQALTDNGLTVQMLSSAQIAGGALSGVSALFVNRVGSGSLSANAAVIDAWVQAGGVLMTEFTATGQLYGDGSSPIHYFDGTLADDFWVPSGFVGGGNTMQVVGSDPVTDGLPPSWVSGNPFGVFWIYTDPSVPQNLTPLVTVQADYNGDGQDEVIVGRACVGSGAVIPFLADFADFASPPYVGTPEEYQLFLNVMCRASSGGCGCEIPDYFGKYAVITKDNASIASANIYTGIAIGGDLYIDNNNQIQVCANTPGASCDALYGSLSKKTTQSRLQCNGCNIEMAPDPEIDWSALEQLARNIKESDSGDYKVFVVNHGGVFDQSMFLGREAQDYDRGKTLVVFNTTESVILKKTPNGRKWGPSILAPFAKVSLDFSNDFIDGSVIAREFVSVKGGQHLHGDAYKGPITCD